MNSRRFGICLAGAVATVALLCLAACSTSTKAAAPAKGAAAQAVSALPACRPGDDPLRLLAPAKLTGPAAGSVTAGRVTKSWSVDKGDIRVSAAPAGSKPTVPMQQAACNLLAAITPDGYSPAGWVAAPGLGSTLGYGRLSVSADLPHPVTYRNGAQITTAPSSFENRPAWILTTVTSGPVCACAAMLSTPSPAPTPPSSWGYRVFAVDATTGSASISYIEAGSQERVGQDPASSTVPYEIASVRWRLLSVSADRNSGQLELFAPACETVSLDGALVDSERPVVQAVVTRAVGRACGPSTWRPAELHPASETRVIPQHFAHAPIGPVDQSASIR